MRAFFTAVCVAFSLWTSNGPVMAQTLADRIVGVVGDEIILLSDFMLAYRQALIQANIRSDASEDVLKEIQGDVVNSVIEERILLEKAEEDSIEISEGDVDFELKNRLANFKQQAGGEEEYRNALKEIGITENDLRRMFRRNIRTSALISQIQQRLALGISVSYDEVKEFYDSVIDTLPEVPEEYTVAHIFIAPKPLKETLDEALKKAQMIHQRLMDGESFGKLAMEYSEDPGTRDKGGDLGYFGQDEMVPEFTQIVFGLKVGDISEPFQTRYGYHIVEVTDVKGSRIGARHILVRIQPGSGGIMSTVETLKEIRRKILEGGDFAEMARLYSEDDQTKNSGGLFPSTNPGQLPQSFRDALKGMKEGDISEPFQSQWGYHLVKLVKYLPSRMLSLTEDRGIIEMEVKSRKMVKAYEKMITEMKGKMYIDIRLDELRGTR